MIQTLHSLLADLPVEWEGILPEAEIKIAGLEFDSRKIKPGDLFVAMKGGNVDGHQYIDSAVEKGAVAVVGMEEITSSSVPYFRVRDSREAFAWLSAAFYGHPARKMTVIGVTGTDGKTTTSSLIFEILKAAGIKAGMISTVNAVLMDEEIDTGFHVTTPEANDIQKYLAMMVDAGITHVVLETTSHGLVQQRVTGCEYDVAVVTNVTHEHLDYHHTYQEYLAAKGKLFEMLYTTATKECGNPRYAILNADDRSFESLKKLIKGPMISYSANGAGQLNAHNIRYLKNGIQFQVEHNGSTLEINCPLPGDFNVSNCLAAVGATLFALGLPREAIQKGIQGIRGVSGRMESIDLGQDFTALVDFAHTPNGLEQALKAVRRMTEKRVIAVFGSAGLRDREKRKMMAVIATRLADIAIFTAEDPRTESLDGILAEMAGAADAAGGVEGKTYYRIPDRGTAIQMGVNLAQPDDLVAAFGKGHEQSMCFGTVEYPWDDRIAMKAAVARKLGCPGPEMPVLPTLSPKK